MKKILNFYRSLPWFKGKLRLGKMIFRSGINQQDPVSFKAHDGVYYKIPNTKENLGVELLINGVYEQGMVRFLKKQIQDEAIYFDIGANIGSLGLPVVKSKKNVCYYGFEASPWVFQYLEENFKNNKIHHFELHNKLVHKDDGQFLKFYQSELYGKSSLAPTYSQNFVKVPSINLDSFCAKNNISHIDWMKVDVQGFELYVFEGMTNMLAQKRINNLLFECEDWAEEAAGLRGGMAKEYLQGMGYYLFTLEGNPWQQRRRGNDTMIWAKPTNQ